MNIIIPIGGIGNRFIEDGYNLPKPLIKAQGRQMIFWVLDKLKIEPTDNVVIVHRAEFNKFSFKETIKKEYPNFNFKFVDFSYDTRGASETVLIGLSVLSDKEINNPTIIIDSDSFYEDDILSIAKQKNENLIFYFKDTDKNPIYSYISTNFDGRVLDIKEKEKISDNACAGAYCFKTAKILKNTIEEVIRENEKQKGEFYISNLYKHLINKNENIYSSEVKNFTCLGTPQQLKTFCSNFSNTDKKIRFCYDLDNTLVSFSVIPNDYTTVEPIEKNIKKLRKLKEMGHYIIISTARRMQTHKGNVSKIIADVGKITLDTLDKFNIPYDEIHFGKPHAHFYIDDLAVNLYSDVDKEIGFYDVHPETRDHNSIEIFDKYVIKRSKNIDGEKYWYQNIPKNIEGFFPKLLGCGDNYIKIEKINGIPFSFLHINKTLTKVNLENLLSKTQQMHRSDELYCKNTENFNIYDNYSKKFIDRQKMPFMGIFGNGSDSIFEEVNNKLIEYEKKESAIIGIIHGDPVFTNILIDNKDNIKFVDMRGKLGDTLSIKGDIFYDYAKIYQSLIGYDFILLDKEIDKDYINEMIDFFEKYIIEKFGKEKMQQIKYITASLLISLIPLHNNEKCEKYFELAKSIL